MNLYVWRGPRVLKNYTSGLVVIAAPDENTAWALLYKTDLNAWYTLQYGVRYMWDDADFSVLEDDDFPEGWETVYPEVFGLDDLPVLVMQGGE
jgi:hypothetical protein